MRMERVRVRKEERAYISLMSVDKRERPELSNVRLGTYIQVR